MTLNKLRLNDDKTEFLTICAPQNRKHISTDSLTAGGSEVAAAQRARNLGVVMEQTLSMDHHIQNLCHAALAQLRNIADVRHCLTGGAAETLVHAFVTSRLDYCNALFHGISTSMRKTSVCAKQCGSHFDRRWQNGSTSHQYFVTSTGCLLITGSDLNFCCSRTRHYMEQPHST